MEWFLQLLPVVPRALLHRCLPSKTKKKTFKNAPDWFFFYDVAYILINAINIENKLSMLFIMNLLVINLE